MTKDEQLKNVQMETQLTSMTLLCCQCCIKYYGNKNLKMLIDATFTLALWHLFITEAIMPCWIHYKMDTTAVAAEIQIGSSTQSLTVTWEIQIIN